MPNQHIDDDAIFDIEIISTWRTRIPTAAKTKVKGKLTQILKHFQDKRYPSFDDVRHHTKGLSRRETFPQILKHFQDTRYPAFDNRNDRNIDEDPDTSANSSRDSEDHSYRHKLSLWLHKLLKTIQESRFQKDQWHWVRWFCYNLKSRHYGTSQTAWLPQRRYHSILPYCFELATRKRARTRLMTLLWILSVYDSCSSWNCTAKKLSSSDSMFWTVSRIFIFFALCLLSDYGSYSTFIYWALANYSR